MAEKSNEIAIPNLPDLLVIEGAIITIDAMGCQRDIAQKMAEKKADYVLALKRNQGSLREDVELFVAEQKAAGFRDTTISRDQTVDGDHGRVETRTTTVIHDIGWLQERHDWPGLKPVVVESERETADKIERETRFYLTSLALMACVLGPIVRSRWAIREQPALGPGHGVPRRSRARQLLYDQARGAEPDPIGSRKGFPAAQMKDRRMG